MELNQIGRDKIAFVLLPLLKPAKKIQFGFLSFLLSLLYKIFKQSQFATVKGTQKGVDLPSLLLPVKMKFFPIKSIDHQDLNSYHSLNIFFIIVRVDY